MVSQFVVCLSDTGRSDGLLQRSPWGAVKPEDQGMLQEFFLRAPVDHRPSVPDAKATDCNLIDSLAFAWYTEAWLEPSLGRMPTCNPVVLHGMQLMASFPTPLACFNNWEPVRAG